MQKTEKTIPLPSINPNSLSYCTGLQQSGTCLLSFAGYSWWTNYHWSQETGIWDPSFDQIFNPNNVTVDENGHMHLKVNWFTSSSDPVGSWASAEAVLYEELGNGTFSFTVKGLQAWFDAGESNLVFGAFTYQPTKDPSKNSMNPHIELDAVEISRWGNPSQCPAGTAQFVVQPWNATPQNKHVIQLDASKDSLNVKMRWQKPGKPVAFGVKQSGDNPLAWLAGAPASKDVLPYVPTTDGELFHFNFWQFRGQGPSDANSHELIISDFNFVPISGDEEAAPLF